MLDERRVGRILARRGAPRRGRGACVCGAFRRCSTIGRSPPSHIHPPTSPQLAPLIAHLDAPSDDLREQCTWALGNIAGDSAENRDVVLRAGALPFVVAQLDGGDRALTALSAQRNATWALSNFCRAKPSPVLADVTPALPVLKTLLGHADPQIVEDACWAISFICDGERERIQAVVESDVCAKLVELVAHPHVGVHIPALRAMGNVVTGDDAQTQVVLDGGALPALRILLDSPKTSIRKEACWAISNIAAGSRDQIQAVLDADLVAPLVRLFSRDDVNAIRKEVGWVLANIASSGTSAQIEHLAVHGECIAPLCAVGLRSAADATVVTNALETLDCIFSVGRAAAGGDQFALRTFVGEAEAAGGVAHLRALQTDYAMPRALRSKAGAMLTAYFNVTDVTGVLRYVADDGAAARGSEHTECVVCYESNELVTLTACGHRVICVPCLETWIAKCRATSSRPAGCPTCRTEIAPPTRVVAPPSIATPLTGVVELPIAGAVLQVVAATRDAATAEALAVARDELDADTDTGSIDALMAEVSSAEVREFRAATRDAAAAAAGAAAAAAAVRSAAVTAAPSSSSIVAIDYVAQMMARIPF